MSTSTPETELPPLPMRDLRRVAGGSAPPRPDVVPQPAIGAPESPPEISIVLPCLNEEAAIGGCIDAIGAIIARQGINAEIVVVDNASTDRTAEIARARGVRIVEQPVRGYGNAYLKGFAEA
ncbi:MAG: glycosyltransferase, partial [Ktedonobacterales bacterium]|nr:glycosyltransferase [Ktedonobacterales bacterium]